MDVILLEKSKYKYSLFLLIIGFFFFTNDSLIAQDDENRFYKSDTVHTKVKRVDLLWLPIVFYTPETSFGFGVWFIFQIKKNNPTLIRFDVGVNKFGEALIYFGVNEAF